MVKQAKFVTLNEGDEMMPCPECGETRVICQRCRERIAATVERCKWVGYTLSLDFGDGYEQVSRDHDR